MSPINTKSVIGQDSGPKVEHQMPEWEMKDDIVISGISGRFPESDNIDELRDNLYNNVDMVTEDERRWPFGLYGLPTRGGKIKDSTKFDAQFFEVHGKQANLMDPQGRLLLETDPRSYRWRRYVLYSPELENRRFSKWARDGFGIFDRRG